MKESKIVIALLGVIALFLLVVALQTLKSVFVPLILALMLSVVLKPAVELLRKLKFPHWSALSLVMISVLAILYMTGVVIYSGIASFIKEYPRYQTSLENTLQSALLSLNIGQDDLLKYLGQIDWNSYLQNISFGSTITGTAGAFFNFIGYTTITLIFAVFLLAGKTRITDKIIEAFPTERAENISSLINTIQSRIKTYLLVKLLINTVSASLCYLALLFFGVDFALIAAVMIFVFGFIPNIGSIIATAFPLIVCFVEFGFTWKIVGVLASLSGIQMLFGNLLEPLLVGRGLNLHPIVIICSLIFWGWVWGLIGMILAVPMTSTLVIICESVEGLKPIAIIMRAGKEK